MFLTQFKLLTQEKSAFSYTSDKHKEVKN